MARQLLHCSARIVCFSGAGLSAESGVPTFRDSQAASGALWSRYDPMTLASPEGFARDPNAVIEWYNWRRRAIAVANPNAAHLVLAARESQSLKAFVNMTQNVDDLLHRAGAQNIIQLHGSIAVDHCEHRCGWNEQIDLNNPPSLRNCAACGALVRPGVVWFGEALPPDAWHAAEHAVGRCDVLLVVGTSALVYPAAGLIALAKSAHAKIIGVNTQSSGASHLADIELLGPAAQVIPRLFDVEIATLPAP
jgi:NAD-dependent deacetylase